MSAFDRDGEPVFDSACARRDFHNQQKIERLTAELSEKDKRIEELEKALDKWPCGCLALGDCCPSCEARRALDGEE